MGDIFFTRKHGADKICLPARWSGILCKYVKCIFIFLPIFPFLYVFYCILFFLLCYLFVFCTYFFFVIYLSMFVFCEYYFALIFRCIFVVQKARLLPKMLVSFLNSRDFMLNIFPVFSNFCVRKTRSVLPKHSSLSLSLSLLSQ